VTLGTPDPPRLAAAVDAQRREALGQ